MNNITIEGNILRVGDKSIEFQHEIKTIIEIGDYIIVRLLVDGKKDDYNNIYGVKDEKIDWRVQDMLEYNENCAPFLPDPYIGIRVYDKDESLIIATTFGGFRMLIDPQTGKIVGEESWVR